MTLSIITPTRIKLVSDALVMLGEKPCTSLDEPRYGVTVGANLFDWVYENELATNRWRFAMQKRRLAQLVDRPLNEWRYAYHLPSDMLLAVGTYPTTNYEIYGKHLYTNNNTVDFEYMVKPEISELPPYFAMLMVCALAKFMVKPITESDSGLQLLTQRYNDQFAKAAYADSQGRPNISIRHSPYTEARGYDGFRY